VNDVARSTQYAGGHGASRFRRSVVGTHGVEVACLLLDDVILIPFFLFLLLPPLLDPESPKEEDGDANE
jgi:hypothetical protein